MNHQVLYPVLKGTMDLTLHILAAKGTSETTTRLGTHKGKRNQLLRKLTASLMPPQGPRSTQSGHWGKKWVREEEVVALTRSVRLEDSVFWESCSLVSLKKTLWDMTERNPDSQAVHEPGSTREKKTLFLSNCKKKKGLSLHLLWAQSRWS